MKIKSIKKINNSSKRYDIQTTTNNFFANDILVHNSMIRPIETQEGFRLGTKAGVTDVAMNAEVFIADKPHYSTFINKCIQKGTTPIFEWVSRKNRIVVDYPEDNLILTAIRYLDTGAYVQYQTMKTYAESWNIPVVRAIDGLSVQNIELFVKQIREWDDGEGIVLRFDTGHMFKVKSDDYVFRHKSKDAIHQEKNVIQIILDDSVDDLVPLLTQEDSQRLQAFQRAFWVALEDVATDIHDRYRAIERGQDQKKFATVAVPSVPEKYRQFMFRLRQGQSAKDMIIEKISKSLSSQTKVNEIRWLFGGISWN